MPSSPASASETGTSSGNARATTIAIGTMVFISGASLVAVFTLPLIAQNEQSRAWNAVTSSTAEQLSAENDTDLDGLSRKILDYGSRTGIDPTIVDRELAKINQAKSAN